MNNTDVNPQERRKGIFLLLLPLLVLPILLLLNWKMSPAQAADLTQQKGLNTVLPEPQFKEVNASKSEAYAYQKTLEKKETELSWTFPDLGSADLSDQEGPEFEVEYLQYPKRFSSKQEGVQTQNSVDFGTGKVADLNREEELIENRLVQIQEILNSSDPGFQELDSTVSGSSDPEILRLEQLMAEMKNGRDKEPDPELVQLESLMDKIIKIQYPGQFQQENENSDEILLAMPKEALELKSKPEIQSIDEEVLPVLENGFYGLEGSFDQPNDTGNGFRKTFAAQISRTQEILPGEGLEILLQEDLVLGTQLIPSGTTVYGTTSLSGSRLQVTVSGILWKKELIPVSLKVYSLDALPGLEINSVKGSAQVLDDGKSGLQNLNMGTIGMDWEAQVANSGINATRKFLNSKSKAKTLSIKGGHPLLFVNSNSNSNR